jgi:hypothetical protein
VGAAAIILVLFYLWLTEFGVRHRFDAALSVSIPGDSAAMRERVEQILHRFSDRTILTGERLSPHPEGTRRNILSYRLLLRDPARRADLRTELASAGDVHELSFYLQDDESEV